MQRTTLGRSGLSVSPVCLGTMTFGQQVDEPTAHAILDRAVAHGIDFIDTAEMYAVPARAETYGATEAIIGRWFASRPGMRQRVVLASKVAGPSRGMPWVRNGSRNLRGEDITKPIGGLGNVEAGARVLAGPTIRPALQPIGGRFWKLHSQSNQPPAEVAHPSADRESGAHCVTANPTQWRSWMQ